MGSLEQYSLNEHIIAQNLYRFMHSPGFYCEGKRATFLRRKNRFERQELATQLRYCELAHRAWELFCTE